MSTHPKVDILERLEKVVSATFLDSGKNLLRFIDLESPQRRSNQS